MNNIADAHFKIGDWIILTEEFVLKWEAKGMFAVFIEHYNKPMEIVKMNHQANTTKVDYQFEDGTINPINVNDFRVATETEVIKNKIKSIFIKNSKGNNFGE